MRGWSRPKSPSACPFCDCRWLWRNRRYRRTVQTLEGPRSFWVRQWKCAECGRTCADRIPGAEKGARYALEVKRKAVRTLFDSEQDVAHTIREMRRNRGWSPSASTVRRALGQAASEIRAPKPPSSGILLSDEKYVRIAGRKRPVLILRDTHQVVRAAEVIPNRSPEAIEEVMEPVQRWTQAHTLVTDDMKSYRVVARDLRLRHQMCQFHLLRAVNRRLHRYLGRKRWGMSREDREREKQKIRDMFRSFCRARGRRQQVAWVRAIARLPRRHPPLARFVAHFLRTWPVYHTFRRVRGCPKTNNGSEGGIARLEKHLARLRGFRSQERANGFLLLWALHWNYRPMETGPHRGKCPLELARLDVKGQDWMDCTGLTE